MRNIPWKQVFLGVGIVVTDLLVYVILGILLMGYDDTYTESKGEYWSLASMTAREQVIYLGMQVWNVLNIVAVVYIIYRFTGKYLKRALTKPITKNPDITNP